MIFQLNYRPRQLTFPLDRLCSITIYVKIQWQRHPLVGSSWNKNILKVMIMYKKATSFLIGGVAMLHCFKIHVVKKCRNFQRLMLDKLICFGGKQKWKCPFSLIVFLLIVDQNWNANFSSFCSYTNQVKIVIHATCLI